FVPRIALQGDRITLRPKFGVRFGRLQIIFSFPHAGVLRRGPKLVGEPEPPATLDKQVGKHDSLLKAEMIAARRIDSRRKSKTVLSLGDDGSAEDIVRRIADRRGRIGLARKGGEAAMIAEDHQI